MALGIAIGISAAMIGASYHFWETGDRELKRAESTLRASRAQYRTVDEQEAMIAIGDNRFYVGIEAGYFYHTRKWLP